MKKSRSRKSKPGHSHRRQRANVGQMNRNGDQPKMRQVGQAPMFNHMTLHASLSHVMKVQVIFLLILSCTLSLILPVLVIIFTPVSAFAQKQIFPPTQVKQQEKERNYKETPDEQDYLKKEKNEIDDEEEDIFGGEDEDEEFPRDD